MRIESWVGMTLVLLLIVPDATRAAEPCDQSPLPANVEFPRDLAFAARRVYERSATFRKQCARIGMTPHLRVTVRVNFSLPSHCRALTVVERRSGRIHADVHLPPSSDHSELLAHEFEHLVEQIEGLDLRRLSRVKGSGVREVLRNYFETDRAQAAGRRVAAEAGRWSRMPSAD